MAWATEQSRDSQDCCSWRKHQQYQTPHRKEDRVPWLHSKGTNTGRGFIQRGALGTSSITIPLKALLLSHLRKLKYQTAQKFLIQTQSWLNTSLGQGVPQTGDTSGHPKKHNFPYPFTHSCSCSKFPPPAALQTEMWDPLIKLWTSSPSPIASK